MTTTPVRSTSRLWLWLSYVLIALVALIPRVLDLGNFISGDEANFWLRRSETFWRALASGDFAATAISTHPGVTTMWLGGLGLFLQDFAFDAGLVRDGTYASFLSLVRLPVVIVHSLVIVVSYGLLRKMLPALAAFLAALFWAADPFMIGYSRVLHVDGLAGTFLGLSMIAACVYWQHDSRHRWMVLAAISAALAILSKSPALAIAPFYALLCLFKPLVVPADPSEQQEPTRLFRLAPLSTIMRNALILGGVTLATIVLLWPTLWTGPQAAIAQLRLGVEAEGAEPHMLGNFFRGQPDDAPGWLFYPASLAMRLTPWTLLGILALPFALYRASRASRRDLIIFVSFAIFFIAAMSIFPKKFNRYLIPIAPQIDVLAAIGYYALFQSIATLLKNRKLASFVQPLAIGLSTCLACWNISFWHPYPITAFNQVLGGARAGERMFLVGWGEGFGEVAAWLNQQPDITGVVTMSPMRSSLQPFMVRRAQVLGPAGTELPRKTGYVVIYIRQVQDYETDPPFAQFYEQGIPLHTVTLNGVDYAWIYQAPPQLQYQDGSQFGDSITLQGFDIINEANAGDTLLLSMVWYNRLEQSNDIMMFAHILGEDGQRIAQIDLPLDITNWQPGRYQRRELPITLPSELSPGKYTLSIGLYNLDTFQRWPLTSEHALEPAINGPDALELLPFEIQ